MDHHDHIQSDGPFPGGWIWALVAAVVVAAVARWFSAPLNGALLVGAGTFVVYAVLLGQFWEAPASGDDHGHGHGHDHGHDHGGHAH